MIKYKFGLCEVDATYATMTISMTIKEWKEFKSHLYGSYPDWKISSAINDLLTHAMQHFSSESEME